MGTVLAPEALPRAPVQAPVLKPQTTSQVVEQSAKKLATQVEGIVGSSEPARLSKSEQKNFHDAVTFGLAFTAGIAQDEHAKYKKRFEALEALRNRIAEALGNGTLDQSFGKQWHEITSNFVAETQVPGLAKYDPRQVEIAKTGFIAGTLTKRQVNLINDMQHSLAQSIRDLERERKRIDDFLAAVKAAGVSDWTLMKEMQDNNRDAEQLIGRLRDQSGKP